MLFIKKYFIRIFLICAILLSFVGCVKTISGTYYSTNGKYYIELKSDGSFKSKVASPLPSSDGDSYVGTYVMKNDEVWLKVGSYPAVVYKIKDKTLVDDSGKEVYSKK